MDLSKIKTVSESKLIVLRVTYVKEQERLETRKRNLLVLMLSHLKENGFSDSFERLQKESGLNYNFYQVADNIDLTLILQV
jgi:katanin p60 ATPase-containing subunit A1